MLQNVSQLFPKGVYIVQILFKNNRIAIYIVPKLLTNILVMGRYQIFQWFQYDSDSIQI